MARHVNEGVALNHWDSLLGTVEEWAEASLRDDSSPQASRIRHLLREFRDAVVQRKTALKPRLKALQPLLNSAWAAGPPSTVRDELLDLNERAGVGVKWAALSDAIEAFESERRK